MDNNDRLYDLYLRYFAMMRAGLALEQRDLTGGFPPPESGGGDWRYYDTREMLAVALGVRDGKLDSAVPGNKLGIIKVIQASLVVPPQ